MPLNFLLLCPVLFALSGAAQDVGAPGMPNVDLETPSGQKLAAEKATIRKFFVLLYLAVLLPVVENQGEVFREKDLYPLILAAFPEQELKECPQKLQKLMNARVQALKEAADGKRDLQSEPFNPEDPEVLAFLAEYGWEVSAEPVQTQQVRVPEEPGEVFLRYNELQVSQGYDLLQYSGQELTRYVYQVTNYPDSSGTYYATLLVKDGQIVGADIASSAKNGVMHGLKMPE